VGAEQQYVVFRLIGQLFGASIDVVREVTYLSTVTHLPNTPAYVDGVIDLRGEVLPVVDLRKRLGLPQRDEAEKDARLMILNLGERSAALVVDGVDQVINLDPAEIVAPDQQLTLPGQDYVTGMVRSGERLVVLLDLDRVMEMAR
jgi:purine-binding chemotaxis protein CheW